MSIMSLLPGRVRWHHPRNRFTRVKTIGGRGPRGGGVPQLGTAEVLLTECPALAVSYDFVGVAVQPIGTADRSFPTSAPCAVGRLCQMRWATRTPTMGYLPVQYVFYSAPIFSKITATAWPEPMQIPITP